MFRFQKIVISAAMISLLCACTAETPRSSATVQSGTSVSTPPSGTPRPGYGNTNVKIFNPAAGTVPQPPPASLYNPDK